MRPGCCPAAAGNPSSPASSARRLALTLERACPRKRDVRCSRKCESIPFAFEMKMCHNAVAWPVRSGRRNRAHSAKRRTEGADGVAAGGLPDLAEEGSSGPAAAAGRHRADRNASGRRIRTPAAPRRGRTPCVTSLQDDETAGAAAPRLHVARPPTSMPDPANPMQGPDPLSIPTPASRTFQRPDAARARGGAGCGSSGPVTIARSAGRASASRSFAGSPPRPAFACPPAPPTTRSMAVS